MEGLAPERHVILVEIGLRAQNMLTILDSIVNMTGGYSYELQKFTRQRLRARFSVALIWIC
jgi:hypothetical protein